MKRIDDVIVVELEDRMTDRQYKAMRDQLKVAFPSNRIVVIEQGKVHRMRAPIKQRRWAWRR